jgi:hypothetical protein
MVGAENELTSTCTSMRRVELETASRRRDAMKRTCLLITLAVLLVATGAVLAAGTPAISRDVIAAGGGRISAGDYTLSATVGQPLTGRAVVGSSDLCVGFWCGLARYDLFLPLILRS